MFQSKHPTIKKILVPLRKYNSDRYNFNILIIIAITNHIYIESELYNLEYIKIKVGPIKWNLENNTIGK